MAKPFDDIVREAVDDANNARSFAFKGALAVIGAGNEDPDMLDSVLRHAV